MVRKTGGLNDTVYDIDDDVERAHSAGMEPNGFSFVGADAAGLDYALNRWSQTDLLDWSVDQTLMRLNTSKVEWYDLCMVEPLNPEGWSVPIRFYNQSSMKH